MSKTTMLSKKFRLTFGVFKGVIVFLLITLSFFHVFFDRYSPEYLSHKKIIKKIVKKRDEGNENFLNQYLLDLKKQYPEDKNLHKKTALLIADYSKFNSNIKEEVKIYNNQKREIVSASSFRGRSSFRFWLFVFGLVTALFYFACKSLFDEIAKGSTFKHQLVSLAGIIVACFWFTHLLFFTQSDFNKNVYFIAILGIAILFSVFTYFLIKYYSYKDQIIYNLLGLVGRIKNKHYQRMATKAMYSERNESAVICTDTTKENMNDFDTDIIETLKRI